MPPTPNITIPKKEYLRLQRQATAYQKLASRFFQSALHDSAENVATDFRATNLYEEGFLQDLEEGLKHSSYFKSRK